jgi:membrane protease YdiL (CAAX protease family)
VPASRLGKIIQFPLVRSVVAVLFFVPVVLFHNVLVMQVLEKISQPLFSFIFDIETILNLALFVIAFRLYTKYVEKRTALEMSPAGCLRETGAGFLVGGGLVVLQVTLMWLFSFYAIESFQSNTILLHALFFFGIGAFIQELIFRVILFRNIEELLGSWLALVAVALVFSLAHLLINENGTWWTLLALIFGDALLTGAYILTRRLWLVWGIHMSWNYFQDGIFGMPNSGLTSLKSWIVSTVDGPHWLTGGSFGIEASIFAVLASLLVGVMFLRKAAKENQIVKPIWSRGQ